MSWQIEPAKEAASQIVFLVKLQLLFSGKELKFSNSCVYLRCPKGTDAPATGTPLSLLQSQGCSGVNNNVVLKEPWCCTLRTVVFKAMG